MAFLPAAGSAAMSALPAIGKGAMSAGSALASGAEKLGSGAEGALSKVFSAQPGLLSQPGGQLAGMGPEMFAPGQGLGGDLSGLLRQPSLFQKAGPAMGGLGSILGQEQGRGDQNVGHLLQVLSLLASLQG